MSVETFSQFADRIAFYNQKQVDQIISIIWYLHVVSGRDRVITKDIRERYEEIHIGAPNISAYLSYLSGKTAKKLIRDKRGYRLEGNIRKLIESKFNESVERIQIKSLLTSLIETVDDKHEKLYLKEALDCYSVQAYRACTVMVWNLAFSHLRNWISSDTNRLSNFNHSLAIKYPKKSCQVISLSDFDQLKEFEVIETIQHTKLISKNICEILQEKLKRRNIAAHPSAIVISQSQADDFITDLINNVVANLR